jgi:hypothetical protein
VEEFAEGVARIRTLAREAGRDMNTISLSVFGMEGQWQKPEEIAALEQAGAERVTLWVSALDTAGALKEIDVKAKTHRLSR